MTATAGTIDASPPDQEAGPDAQPHPIDHAAIRPPRALPWELALYIVTFGFYFCVYLYRLTKDLNRITGKDYTHWLWLLAPLVGLAQLIAYPLLLEDITNAEKKTGITRHWGIWALPWVLAMFGITVLINLSDKFNVPTWALASAATLSCTLFALFHLRINRLRRQARKLGDMEDRPARFSVMEWVVAAPLGLLVLLAAIGLLVEEFALSTNTVRELPEGSSLSYPGHPVELNISHEGWLEMEPGFESDGAEIIQIQAEDSESFAIVNHYGVDADIDNIAAYRVKEAHELLSNPKCEEQRRFVAGTTKLAAVVQCRGSYFGERYLLLSKSLQTEKGVYELHGKYTAPSLAFGVGQYEFLELEKGFNER